MKHATKKPTAKKQICVLLPKELALRVKRMARVSGRTHSDLVESSIRAGIGRAVKTLSILAVAMTAQVRGIEPEDDSGYQRIATVESLNTRTAGAPHTAPAKLSSDELLAAIARIESGHRAGAIGDGGKARGAWQMHRAAWEDVSRRRAAAGLKTAPFEQATNLYTARIYAAAHLDTLRDSLSRAGLAKPTDRQIYAAWNLGVTGFARRGFSIANCPAITRRACEKMK